MRPVNRSVLAMAVIVTIYLGNGCGGGGGRGEGSDPVNSIPYTGAAGAATITGNNAEILALGGYLGGDLGTDLGSVGTLRNASGEAPGGGRGLTGLDPFSKVRGTVTRFILADVSSSDSSARAMAPATGSEPGICGGHADENINVDSRTGNFSGTITFVDYNDCESILSGEIEMSGNVDPFTLTLTRLTIRTYLLEITAVVSGEKVSVCGTIAVRTDGITGTTDMNTRERDETTGRVYWYSNYVITSTNQGPYSESVITGRFYDPDFGYVDLATPSGTRTYWENNQWNDWPSEGMVTASGNGGTKAFLTFLSKNVYRIEADTDGNGSRDFDGGAAHWPGANIVPVADAGSDGVGNVNCLTTLDGSRSSDGDADPLAYTWTIVSAPPGSAAVLSGAATATPSIFPDVAGEYRFGLVVGDGISTSTLAIVTISIGPDLFCTNRAVLIPAAVGSFPRSVAVGDLNGDGRNDVAMATSSTFTQLSDPVVDFHLFVFAQDAAGGLAPPVRYPAGNGKSIAIGDLNQDGRNDVAVTLDDGVGVLLQNGSGGLNPLIAHGYGEPVEQYSFHDVRIADLNNDGRSDIVTAYNRFFDTVVNVFYQNPDGTLGTPVRYVTDFGEWELRVGDNNGDGLSDIVMFSNKSGTGGSTLFGSYVKTMTQNPDGTLGNPTNYLADPSPLFIFPGTFAAGDVTGDTRQDLVISYFDSNTMIYSVGLFPQETGGSVGAPLYLPAFAGIQQIESVDVSGDFRSDVVGYHGGNSSAITVYRQGQQGGLASYELYGLAFPNYNSFHHGFTVGDVNGDGYQDIAVADYIDDGNAGLVVLYGNSLRGSP